MNYLYKRGKGVKRRVVHIAICDRVTGKPTTMPLCGNQQVQFNTTCNVPLGLPICLSCRRIRADEL